MEHDVDLKHVYFVSLDTPKLGFNFVHWPNHAHQNAKTVPIVSIFEFKPNRDWQQNMIQGGFCEYCYTGPHAIRKQYSHVLEALNRFDEQPDLFR